MCRISLKDNPAGNWCTALGEDEKKWDNECLLRPEVGADPSTQVDSFAQALEDLCSDKTLSPSKLHRLEEVAQHDKFRDWYIIHGKISGNFRSSLKKTKIPKVSPSGSNNIHDELLNEVLERDGYYCQYCGCRLIVREVWKNLEKLSLLHGRSLIKTLKQRQGVKDIDVPGLIFATWPFADHVVAYKRGGHTNEENLVASCFACNYGKDNFTCEELGITDPRDKAKGTIINSDGYTWNGLKRFIEPLDIFIRHCP